MKILAIDPGNIESACVLMDNTEIVSFEKEDNNEVLKSLYNRDWYEIVVIEMISSYGMPVGKEVFDTCVWIGRFMEAINLQLRNVKLIYRMDVKLTLCGSNRAKDANIIQALIDRFADVNRHGKYGKGTKKDPGYFFGFYKDIWQAYALGVTYFDSINK